MNRVAAGVSPAVEGTRPPPGKVVRSQLGELERLALIPPGKMPGSTAGRRPASTRR
jgi:hypothetical protein